MYSSQEVATPFLFNANANAKQTLDVCCTNSERLKDRQKRTINAQKRDERKRMYDERAQIRRQMGTSRIMNAHKTNAKQNY